MSRVALPLCSVLAILLAFAGGTIDLCSCGPGVHGALCADQTESHVARALDSCCGEQAPVPIAVVADDDCCGGCCEEEAPAPSPELRGAGCGCPVITLDQSPRETTSVGTTFGLDRSFDLSLTTPIAEAGVPSSGPLASTGVPPWPSWSHRSHLRRHLELHVIRC